jgi:glycosyl-4,4'-diaponeurosporenoate acyltransferase
VDRSLDGARGPAARSTDRAAPLRPFEGAAAGQRRLRVKTWKRWLPEAGRAFGGRSKRHLPARGEAGLPRFLTECRRAERAHWLILAAAPAFALWNPPGLFVAMVVFALVANIPCLIVLRYNRARLLRRTVRPAARRRAVQRRVQDAGSAATA